MFPKRADILIQLENNHVVKGDVDSMKRWLVFTDLDGTLLDEDYGWAAARPAVEALQAASIPIILNSSKTVMEMELFEMNCN